MSISGCCTEVEVIGYGDVRDVYPNAFTTYTMESDLLNGKVHYTSSGGNKAITYVGSKWLIQSASNR